jgi:CHAD domain-containing protein
METEAKFTVPDEGTFKRLKSARSFGVYKRRGGRTVNVSDRYLDTADRRFYARHFYVRAREGVALGGNGVLLTLKRLGAVASGPVLTREEHQMQVPGLDSAEWPQGEVRRLVEEIGGGEPLIDMVTVAQVRNVSVLYQGERAVAECSLDHVMLTTPGEPVEAYEMELELLPDGSMSDLKVLSELLVGEHGLVGQPLSKFERAMLLTSVAHDSTGDDAPVVTEGTGDEKSGPPPAVEVAERKRAKQTETIRREAGVLPTDNIGVAARKIVGMHFGAMMANEEGTRLGAEPEALHDMRVATRRMRAALRLLGPYLGDGGSVGKVRRGLRSVTRALGVVRDLDVLIGQASEFRERLPEEAKEGMDGLLEAWSAQRKRGRKELVRLLDSKEYGRFKRRMERFLAEEDVEADHEAGVEPHQVRHVAGSAIWGRYEAVRAYETVMDAPTLEQLHALRISGKYLRYTLECFRETLPAGAGVLIRDVVGMQDQLGALHDAEVGAVLVRQYMGKKSNKRDVEVPVWLAAYLADREDAMRRLYDDFAGTWEKVSGAKWRGKLAAVIAGV